MRCQRRYPVDGRCYPVFRIEGFDDNALTCFDLRQVTHKDIQLDPDIRVIDDNKQWPIRRRGTSGFTYLDITFHDQPGDRRFDIIILQTLVTLHGSQDIAGFNRITQFSPNLFNHTGKTRTDPGQTVWVALHAAGESTDIVYRLWSHNLTADTHLTCCVDRYLGTAFKIVVIPGIGFILVTGFHNNFE